MSAIPTSALVRYAITQVAVGGAVLWVSWLTYAASPPAVQEAGKANTALYIGLAFAVLMLACAVGTMLVRGNRLVGMIAIHAALVLPLLVASGPLARLGGAKSATAEYYALTPAELTAAAVTIEDPAERPHPRGYQAVGIGSVVAVAVLGFVALVVQRPPVPKEVKKAATPAPQSQAPPTT